MNKNQTTFEVMAASGQELPKLYREKAVFGGTFFGGPLVAAYLMHSNYRAFGEPKKANTALTVGVLFTVLFFYWAMIVGPSKSYNRGLPMLMSFIAYALIHYLQGPNIRAHENAGGKFYSGWRVAGIGAIGLVATIAMIFGLLDNFSFATPSSGLSSKSYGNPICHIYYDSTQMSVKDVDQLANYLIEDGAFCGGNKMDVMVLQAQTEITVTYTIQKGVKSDPKVIESFKSIRDMLQNQYGKKHVTIELSENRRFDDVVKTIK